MSLKQRMGAVFEGFEGIADLSGELLVWQTRGSFNAGKAAICEQDWVGNAEVLA